MNQHIPTGASIKLSHRNKENPSDLKGESLFQPKHGWRRLKEKLFFFGSIATTLVAILVLLVLTYNVLRDGLPWLDWQFLTSFPSRFPEQAGIKSAIFGSIWLGFITLFFSAFFGIGAAVYLQEIAPQNRANAWLEVNIATLAGVPSIIYGMLGLALFVRFLNLERSVLAGGLTLSLLIMPVIIIATREALKSVPDSIRLGAAALGATKWQTVRDHILPSAIPGILTGIILAMARAVGEAAPLIMIGALTYIAFVPESLLDAFTALPIQIFNWTSRPKAEFHNLASAGIIVLLGFLIICNSIAIILRLKWKGHRS